jgi:GR25 family glycosyltransferase involved in LPS biosynthesis
MIMGIDIKTTVIHCKKLKERKVNILRQFERFGFTNFSFYEDYDADELTEQFIKEHYVSKAQDPVAWSKKISLWGPAALHYHSPVCNPAEISLTIKFGKIFQQLSKEHFDYCIIFEDDVFLCENFDVHFPHFLSQTPDDWDAIYFGSGANLKPSRMVQNQVVYLMDHPASRCADSIVLKKSAVCDLANTWFPFHIISDWELGYQHYLHNHKVYWWEPSLVRQGSEHGMFKSTLR